MLLSFLILFFLCEITVGSWSTIEPTDNTSPYETSSVRATVAAEETPSPLQLVAKPDYPVAAGQRVDLHCKTFTMPDSAVWSWQRLENQIWTEVERGRDLTLTNPEQSGLYRCHAETNLSQKRVSPDHAVYIVSMHATVGENLGIAAFVLSLLALIINLAILLWLTAQRPGDTLTISNTAAKGFPEHEKSPKGGLPKADNDGNVYMNYTSTNPAYTDLDPTNMTVDNVYSSLS